MLLCKRNNCKIIFLVVFGGIVITAICSSLIQNKDAVSKTFNIHAATDSGGLSYPNNMYVYPYFKFIQWYDSCNVSCVVGELYVKRQSGDIVFIRWKYFDNIRNRPIPDSEFVDLTNHSISEYVNARSGDTITYYKNMFINYNHPYGGYAGIRDTILFYSELIDSLTSAVIFTADTLGILPCIRRSDIPDKLIAWNDTNTIRKAIIPSNYEGKIALRIRPYAGMNLTEMNMTRFDAREPCLSQQSGMVKTSLKYLYDSLMNNGGLHK